MIDPLLSIMGQLPAEDPDIAVLLVDTDGSHGNTISQLYNTWQCPKYTLTTIHGQNGQHEIEESDSVNANESSRYNQTVGNGSINSISSERLDSPTRKSQVENVGVKGGVYWVVEEMLERYIKDGGGSGGLLQCQGLTGRDICQYDNHCDF